MNKKNELRRFPMEDDFMKGNKNISKSKPNDVLYAYLQMISNFREEDKIRFIYKSNYSHASVEEYFGYDENGKPLFPRKNAERAMKVLKQYGYVRETKIQSLKNNYVSIYELPYDVEKPFQYIKLETLKYLLNTCHPNVIKMYIFFKYKHFCFGDKFVFTYKMLIEEVFGLTSNTNAKTNLEIKHLLTCLKNNGLIDYCEYYIQNSEGRPSKQHRLTYFSDDYKK